MADYILDLDPAVMASLLKWKHENEPENFEEIDDDIDAYAGEIATGFANYIKGITTSSLAMFEHLKTQPMFKVDTFLVPDEHTRGFSGIAYTSYLDAYVGQLAAISTQGSVVNLHTTAGDRIKILNLSKH